MTCLTCMHRTLGGWQFGARYMVDLFPWLFVWCALHAEYIKQTMPLQPGMDIQAEMG